VRRAHQSPVRNRRKRHICAPALCEASNTEAPRDPADPTQDSPGNADDWIQSASVGYVDGPGVATKDTLYWGFGLEGVDGAGHRATLLKDALTYLGAR
jgi:hypothetical protein